MDRRTLLAFALMLLVYVAWTTWFMPPAPEPEPQAEPEMAETTDPVTSSELPAEEPVPAVQPQADSQPNYAQPGGSWLSAPPDAIGGLVRVETDLFIAQFDRAGADLQSFQLKRFRTLDRELVELVPDRSLDSKTERAHELALIFEDGRREPLNEVRFETNVSRLILDASKPEGELVFSAQRESGQELELRFRFNNDEYGFHTELDYSGADIVDLPQGLAIRWDGGIASSEPDTTLEYNEFKAVAMVGDDLHKKKFGDLRKDGGVKGRAGYTGTIRFAGVESQYFGTIVVNSAEAVASGSVRFDGDYGRRLQTFSAELPVLRSNRSTLHYGVYMGPLDPDMLKPFEAEPYNAPLSKSVVDLGPRIFRPVAAATLWSLKALYNVIPNYGWVIILFSTLTKLLFYPLTKSSTQSMKRMQELQPKIQKMRDKYKDDQAKQSQEMMALYKEHKINPLGGCLPLVIQMPVFIALFQVLRKTIELRQAPFIGWIDDLSRPDVLFHMPFSLPFLGDAFSLLPFLMAASMWWQTKISQPTVPQGEGAMAMNARMMGTVMPVMMFFFFYRSPSGLVLYWLLNTILTAAQTWRIHQKSAATTPEASPA